MLQAQHHQERPLGLVAMLAQLLRPQPRQDQDAADAGDQPGPHIAHAVADKDRITQVQAQFVAGAQQQAGARFAAIAMLIFPMWTIIHLLNVTACLLDPGDHPPVDLLYRLYRNAATGYPGLVRTHHDTMPGPRQLRNRLARPRDETKLAPTFDII